MAVVFLVQALVFADGGLTALGLNIIMMGYATCFGGYGIFLLLRKLLPATKAAVTGARPSPPGAGWCWPRACSSCTTPSAAPGTHPSGRSRSR